MSFESSIRNDIHIYSSPLLNSLGIVNGFSDGSLDFRSEKRAAAAQKFAEDFGLRRLLLLNQTHCADFVVLDKDSIDSYTLADADAFILKNRNELKGYGIGVLTADCVPLLISLGNVLSVVHSGWRGLANGIICGVIKEMKKHAIAEKLYVAIGPCAGNHAYEVGLEVVENIGANAVYEIGENNKPKLDLARTAQKIVNSCHTGEVVFDIADICVITNNKFHSFRRDSQNSGRNISFILL